MGNTKRPRIVGEYIRRRREALGISQRALGLLFNPPVTTQFISNVERGVTPLPPAHVSILAKALEVGESEIFDLLEQEFTFKLSGRIRGATESIKSANESEHDIRNLKTLVAAAGGLPNLEIEGVDIDFMRSLYEAYRQADEKTRAAFASVCENVLNLPKDLAKDLASADPEPS